MAPTSWRGRVNPRALVGRILLFNGLLFGVISALLATYTLLAKSGAAVTGLLALIFAGVGLLEGAAGLLVWLFPGVSAPARVANRFYESLEIQDYAAAFACLDLSRGAFFGQTMTEAEFIKRAQAIDAERGPVTNYALAGVRANPGKRVYTIKVTRGSAAYRTRLQMAKQGAGWKIVGFDRF